jgi:O-antigen/teichoic acid export membrane protein
MLAVLARVGDSGTVGRFALGLAIATPVVMLANLQLRNVLVSDVRDRFAFGDYLALRMITTALALSAIAAIAALGGFGPATASAILAVGAAKCVEAMGDLVHGLLQRHERMDRVAASLIASAALSLAALGATFAATRSLTAAVLALSAAWATRLIAFDVPAAAALVAGGVRGLRPRWDPATMRSLAWLALPLGVNMMLLSLNVNIPRYFIEGALGERGLGVFAAISYPLIAGTMLLNSLGQAAIPRLASAFADSDDQGFRSQVARMSLAAAVVGAAGVALAVAAGRPILSLLYGPGYAEAAGPFAWLAVAAAAGFVATPLGYAMTAARAFRPQAPLFAAVATTTLVGAACLVPAFGLTGAAWAILASQVVQIAGSLLVVARAFSSRADSRAHR